MKRWHGSGVISVPVATAVGLGAIIGAGIFVLSGTAIALAGANALFSFILVGILAVIIAVQFGELGSIMPNAKGASFSYTYNAFGSELGFIIGILLYFSFATAISAIALGFGSYLSSVLLLHGNNYPIMFAILLIFILSIVNIIGIKKAARLDSFLVLIKLLILTVFIISAVLLAHFSGTLNLNNFHGSARQSGVLPVLSASIAVFFAYSGFQSISTITSNVRGGASGAARAIVLSVVISMIFYILVIFALMLMVPASKFVISADPLSFALKYVRAPYSIFILVDAGALMATASATLAMILTSSRVIYQISENKLLPGFFRKYDRKRDVPINGVILSALIGVAMLFSGNIYIIAAISNFGLLISYLVSSLALIHFRRNNKTGSFKTPFYPYITVISIVMLLVFILGMPREVLDIGMILIIILLMLYYFLVEFKRDRVIHEELFK
ncbi:APC family permease [Picrophilus oshimae]|uniref:Amino acid/polyamine/organocation transporter, APC superfamily n=1 Tax=Picrophilus torridus (strain ATCC 700027 / DSM 9790 / JCM 10055 / NBRC 100828 / KAW 2/3) TaxID=1122961 RepID=A0A8G2FWP8_PICTO|nr:amino acid permease [Picrophilus oshimae]SMD30863.1 amino acid/polyamine/organocation transporter, APC superfamily [Picrophilus oshimae DSM 9789]